MEIRFIQSQIFVVAIGSGNCWLVALCVKVCGPYLGAKWIGSINFKLTVPCIVIQC